MSKDRQEQAGALLSVEEMAQNQTAQGQTIPTPDNDAPPDNPPGPDQNKGDGKPEPVKPSKLTVDQYLKRAPQGAGISGLVRSLYKTEILTFEEWENKVKALLKKQVR